MIQFRVWANARPMGWFGHAAAEFFFEYDAQWLSQPGAYVLAPQFALSQRLAARQQVPLLVSNSATTMSLAGAQDKVGLRFDSKTRRLSDSVGQSPTTHILKPDTRQPRHAPSAINEYACMLLAKSLKLELIGLLDQRRQAHGVAEEALQSPVLTEAAMRRDTAALLHSMVAGMSLANFVVRPQRRWVEAWAQPEAWERPTQEQLGEVAAHLSGLPTAVRDDDEDAKRFDALLLGTQLALLRSEPSLARLQTRVQQLAGSLLTLSNVPAVREHLLLIEAVAGDEWWQDVTLPMLEQARRKLRSLVKLIEKSSRKVVYTDFVDAIGETHEVDLPLVASAVDFERFRTKAKVFMRAHQDRLALHKLRRNQALTAADLTELESMLREAGGTDGDLTRARELPAGLPGFIRSLVGLDREAAAQAFAGLISHGMATASQLQFIEEVIAHLTEHGAMPAERLYESPFIDIHSGGPDALFGADRVAQLFSALQTLELQPVAPAVFADDAASAVGFG